MKLILCVKLGITSAKLTKKKIEKKKQNRTMIKIVK